MLSLPPQSTERQVSIYHDKIGDDQPIEHTVSTHHEKIDDDPSTHHDKIDDDSKSPVVVNKTLVIVMGNVRGGEEAWHSLYRNVLDVNNADLALALGEMPDEKKKNISLYGRAKYIWEFQEYADWTDALDLIATNNTWHKLLDFAPRRQWNFLGGCRNHKGSGAIVFWIRWFISQHLKEFSLQHKYERFVLTRPDHYYLCEHDLSELSESDVWIPGGQDWGGYTDRHMVAPASKILTLLDILPPLLQNPDRYISVRMNAESFMKHRWNEDGIQPKWFGRMMFTCGAPGDPTRWSPLAGFAVEEGVHLKKSYVDEYRQAHHQCFDKSFTKTLRKNGMH